MNTNAFYVYSMTFPSLITDQLSIKDCADLSLSVATGITKVAKSPFTLHSHLLRKVVT